MKHSKKIIKKPGKKTTSLSTKLGKKQLQLITSWVKSRKTWQKVILAAVFGFALFLMSLYVSSLIYRFKHRNEPITYGVTFIHNYAKYFGLNPRETMLALRDDLGFKRFRLVSYWSDIEKTKGEYDFSELDWQFDQVEAVNGDVTLAIGLRQPRWPECHLPEWAKGKTMDETYPKLSEFIAAVVDRYKDRAALDSYQLENEYFLKVFGECKDFSRERLQKEFDLVKSIDSNTPVILSLANNYFGVPTGDPRPDQFGVSVYKRVYDYTVTKSYFEYPFTPWYYSGRAGFTELLTGKQSMLHELQAEPWAPVPLIEASIEEQSKSMDAKRLKERIEYGEATGFKEIDLWGGEWWYWRKVKLNDPSLWDTIKSEINPELL